MQPNTREKYKKQQQLAWFGCREAEKCQILLDLVVGLKKKKKKKIFLCQLGMCCDVSLCVGCCVVVWYRQLPLPVVSCFSPCNGKKLQW